MFVKVSATRSLPGEGLLLSPSDIYIDLCKVCSFSEDLQLYMVDGSTIRIWDRYGQDITAMLLEQAR